MEMILLLVSWLAIILCSAFLRFLLVGDITIPPSRLRRATSPYTEEA